MSLQKEIARLEGSAAYKDFTKKHKDAYLVAGFFVIDYEGGKNLHQIDFYVPSQKKVAAFTIDRQITMQLLDVVNERIPEKLDAKAKIDLEALQGILDDEMKNRNITEEIRKIIAVLQTVGGKNIWNLNCVLSGMSILNAHVEDSSESVLRMEKKNIVDYMRRMPMPQMSGSEDGEAQATQQSSEDQLKKLNELQAALDKEKAALAARSAQAPKEKALSSASDVQAQVQSAVKAAAAKAKSSRKK